MEIYTIASPSCLVFSHGNIGEVPGESIKALWQEFNLCADGWGIDAVFFEQLCQAMATSMGIEASEKNNKALFSAFDTDKVNTLVTAMLNIHASQKRFFFHGQVWRWKVEGDTHSDRLANGYTVERKLCTQRNVFLPADNATSYTGVLYSIPRL